MRDEHRKHRTGECRRHLAGAKEINEERAAKAEAEAFADAEAEAAEAARRAAREAEQAEREARKSAQAAPAEVYETLPNRFLRRKPMPLRGVQKQKILHSKPVILHSEKWL